VTEVSRNPYFRWFQSAMWLGIFGNLAFAIPAILNPNGLLAWLSLPPAHPTIWLRDAGGLLFLLTLLYIAPAQEPFRYELNGAVAVTGRLAFAVFWFWMVLVADYAREFLTLGIGDLVVGILQAGLYFALMRKKRERWRQTD
jgi:hypothetical protein